jgi:flagellar hook protein FlgE
MAFLRSLFAGVSALRNHQTMMDVIGNNIANVNTIGFKTGRTTFKETYAQTIRAASRPGETGGINPLQVGLGVSISSIDSNFTQGNIESTGQNTDLAIQGDGFFVVKKDGQIFYTRDGRFERDASGKLVNPGTGAIMQGKMADSSGIIPVGTSMQDILIRPDLKSPAMATTTVQYSGNLDSSASTYNPATGVGGLMTTSVSIYDSLGNRIPLSITMTKTGQNAWSWAASVIDSTSGASTSVGTGTLTFNSDGSLNSVTGNTISITPTGGGAPMSVKLDFGTPSTTVPGSFTGVTQSAGKSDVLVRDFNGYQSGTLVDTTIDAGGRIVGTFTNGNVMTLGQVLLAQFSNPAGLLREGQNLYLVSPNSGIPALIDPGDTTRIVSQALEQSNVDLAEEFTRMITAQRGFQASARIITTSDEFLQEVVNLKR